jgi:hypothetical protein
MRYETMCRGLLCEPRLKLLGYERVAAGTTRRAPGSRQRTCCTDHGRGSLQEPPPVWSDRTSRQSPSLEPRCHHLGLLSSLGHNRALRRTPAASVLSRTYILSCSLHPRKDKSDLCASSDCTHRDVHRERPVAYDRADQRHTTAPSHDGLAPSPLR